MPELEDGVHISRPYFLGFNQLIGDLGGIKDEGQIVEALADAAQEAGTAKSDLEALALAQKWTGTQDEYDQKTAEELYARLKSWKLFENVEREIRDSIR